MKKLMVIVACATILLLGTLWAAEKKTERAEFGGVWILAKSKVDQSSPVSGMGGMGGGGRRQSGPGGGGGRVPGGNPGGGRRGGRGGEDPAELSTRSDSSLVIELSDTEFKVIHKVDNADGNGAQFVQTFRLDGSESVNRVQPRGSELRSRTSWEKGKLVTLGTQEPSGGGEEAARLVIVMKQEFSLSKDGKTLTVKTSRTTPRRKVTLLETFTRQSETPK